MPDRHIPLTPAETAEATARGLTLREAATAKSLGISMPDAARAKLREPDTTRVNSRRAPDAPKYQGLGLSPAEQTAAVALGLSPDDAVRLAREERAAAKPVLRSDATRRAR